MQEETNLRFVDAITDALKVERRKPEKALGGKLVHDTTCINVKALNHFSEQAVSVEPPLPDRLPNVSLVLGSRGSGKTVFALRCLADLLRPGAFRRNESLRIHVKLGSLLGSAKTTTNLPEL